MNTLYLNRRDQERLWAHYKDKLFKLNIIQDIKTVRMLLSNLVRDISRLNLDQDICSQLEGIKTRLLSCLEDSTQPLAA